MNTVAWILLPILTPVVVIVATIVLQHVEHVLLSARPGRTAGNALAPDHTEPGTG